MPSNKDMKTKIDHNYTGYATVISAENGIELSAISKLDRGFKINVELKDGEIIGCFIGDYKYAHKTGLKKPVLITIYI